jgi:hypothetical protein
MKPVGDGAKRVRVRVREGVVISEGIETTGEVFLDVLWVFQADGHTDQALTNARSLSLGFGQAAV